MKEYRYKINGNLYKVTVGDIEDNNVHVEVNGTPYTVELEKHVSPKIKPVVRTAATTPAAPPPAISRPTVSQGKSGIKSPLPGVILDIKVKEGDTVKRGQTLLILEAMKMENDRFLDVYRLLQCDLPAFHHDSRRYILHLSCRGKGIRADAADSYRIRYAGGQHSF